MHVLRTIGTVVSWSALAPLVLSQSPLLGTAWAQAPSAASIPQSGSMSTPGSTPGFAGQASGQSAGARRLVAHNELPVRKEPLSGSEAAVAAPALSAGRTALPEAPAPDPALIPAGASTPAAAPILAAEPAWGFVNASARPCRTVSTLDQGPDVDSADDAREPCLDAPDPYHRFLNTTTPFPLTPEQKAHLAVHNLFDPGNLATILGTAGFTIGTDAHTAYGPGWKGFGYDSGISFVQDATGEFFGTFLIPSLTHEDPHYHRMPNASIPRRVVHAISRTVMAQSDDGHPMPNYSCLLTYPITSEIGNLYVPGINGNGPSTTRRIMLGYATDPIDNLITEFLPDVARRIHVRVIFVQSILNQVSSDQYALP